MSLHSAQHCVMLLLLPGMFCLVPVLLLLTNTCYFPML